VRQGWREEPQEGGTDLVADRAALRLAQVKFSEEP
jgi:hypothetical protein